MWVAPVISHDPQVEAPGAVVMNLAVRLPLSLFE